MNGADLPSAPRPSPVSGAVKIRTATRGDRDGILEVVEQAFASKDRDAREELDIVLTTWRLQATVEELELVAIEDGAVVGHVMAGRGDLGGHEVVAIAPLAVTPRRQGLGIGRALMTELLGRAELAALPLVVLLGLPTYYERFGFEASGPLGISYRAVGEGNPHFQVRRFAGYDPSYRGDFTYCWEVQRT
jgi:predicted N-acetyltransferase YhbS